MSASRILLLAALAAVFVPGAAPVRAEGGPSPEAIAKAQTAAEHTAIADAYGAEAAELRKKAAEHRAMLASYDKAPGYLKEKSGLVQHCRSLIGLFEKGAEDAEMMAKMHLDLAKTAKP